MGWNCGSGVVVVATKLLTGLFDVSNGWWWLGCSCGRRFHQYVLVSWCGGSWCLAVGVVVASD